MRWISGIAVAALLAMAGCSSSTGSEPSRSPTDRTVKFSVAEGKRTAGPEEVAVRTGENVALEVTSDQADELHVHGYDRTVQLAPGTPATIGFTADIPGIFEVELHHSGAAVTKLRVTG
jgi:plastocyanin